MTFEYIQDSLLTRWESGPGREACAVAGDSLSAADVLSPDGPRQQSVRRDSAIVTGVLESAAVSKRVQGILGWSTMANRRTTRLLYCVLLNQLAE